MPENEKEHSGSTDAKHQMTAKTPDFTVKWSKEWVIPYNSLKRADADVEMVLESTYPEDRPEVEVTIDRADPPQLAASPKKLALKSKKMVNDKSATPKFQFSKRHGIWDKFDKLEYHFTATIDRVSKQTPKTVKVKRWHVQALDIGDTRASIMGFRNQESANHLASFSASADDAVESHRFDATTEAKKKFGEWMRNTYSYNYTGHGAVVCNTCGSMYDCTFTAGPTFGDWTACPTDASHSDPKSTHCIGPSPWFQGGDVADKGTVYRAPKYLMFSVCCGGAYESSLYDAYIARGTKYCIGFKKSTRCDWARDYTKSFFDTWCKTHKCDPDKIPEIFDALQATWEAKLAPVLFGGPAPAPPAPPPPPAIPAVPAMPAVPPVPPPPALPAVPAAPSVPSVPSPPPVPSVPATPTVTFAQSVSQAAREVVQLIRMLF